MKKKLIKSAMFLALLGTIMVGCDKIENLSPNLINTANNPSGKEAKKNGTSDNTYTYYREDSPELKGAIYKISDIIGYPIDQLLKRDIVEMIRFWGPDNKNYDALAIGDNKYIIISPRMKLNYFLMSVSEESYTLYDWKVEHIAVMDHELPISDSKASGSEILGCIQDHFDDICGDNFWTSLACIAGCAGCPECCLGAAVIFGIGCALDHGVYEADPNEASDMIKDFEGKQL